MIFWHELWAKCLKNRWCYIELFFLWVYWEIPVFIMFWIKFCTMVKHSSVTGVLELSGALTTDLDLVWLTLLLICEQNDSFDSCLWNGFLERMLRIKPNNIIAVFFFQDFIQLCDSRKIPYLTCEFHVKLHTKTNIARIANSLVR